MNLQQLPSYLLAFSVGVAGTYLMIGTKGQQEDEQANRDPVIEESDSTLREQRKLSLVGNDFSDSNVMEINRELDSTVQQLRDELETLRLENDELRQGSMILAEEVDHTQKRFDDSEKELLRLTTENRRLERELGQFAESDITDEQMKALLEPPFSNFLIGFKGKRRDELYEFFNEPEDHEWGYDLQLHITDFIANHELQQSVQLVGVTCKINKCEFRIIEPEPELGHFHIIFQEMRRQPWFQFTSTHSTSGNLETGPGSKIFFYLTR